MKKFLFLILLPMVVNAGEDTVLYSVSPSLFFGSLDGENSSESTISVIPIAFSIGFKTTKYQRALINLSLIDINFDAEGTEIGQSLEGVRIDFNYQWHLRLSKRFRPWIGVGVFTGNYDAESRHLVDSEGFLIQRLDDKSISDAGIVINFTNQFKISNIPFNYELGYYQSLDDGLSGFAVKLGYTF